MRAEPRADAEQVTQLLRGEPVSVLEERDGWARIETAYGYPGWARADALRGPPIEEPWPAPLPTLTSKPSLINRLTVSGVAATRRSPG